MPCTIGHTTHAAEGRVRALQEGGSELSRHPLLPAGPSTTPHPEEAATPTSRVMASVMARQFCHLQNGPHPPPPPLPIPPIVLSHPVSTPLRVEQWQEKLASHPNREWVAALLTGIRCGFRIGLQTQVHCRATHRNAPSALAQGPAVGKFLAQQLASGRIIGPLCPQDCPGIFTSSIAAIPKKTPGQWRVIVDLLSPVGASVNDNLRREFAHVAYSSVKNAAMMLHSLGEGALLAKIGRVSHHSNSSP